VELIERRKRWLEVSGQHSSEDDPENGHKKDNQKGPDWEWDETIKGTPAGMSHPPTVSEEKKEVVKKETKKPVPAKHNEKVPAGAEKAKKPVDKPKPKAKPKKPSDNKQSSALTSVIHPAINKLLQGTKDPAVQEALNHIKSTFDAAESTQTGITHNFIAQIIDTLKG